MRIDALQRFGHHKITTPRALQFAAVSSPACLGVLTLLLAAAAPGGAEDWNRFRGPNGSGIVEDGAYPARLTSANLVWRSPVRPGKSSPVLTASRIFVTAFEDETLYTQCFDRASGVSGDVHQPS